MNQPGRNDPCPCGSGQKYKRCCLAKDQQARHVALAVAQAADDRLHDHEDICPCCYDELIAASNATAALVRAGKLDEAEIAARKLVAEFPDVHEGYDRLGMVYEARGDHRHAAQCYRKALELLRARPDDYDPELATVFHELIEKLDPTTEHSAPAPDSAVSTSAP